MIKRNLINKNIIPNQMCKIFKDNNIPLKTLEIPLNVIANDLKKDVDLTEKKFKLKSQAEKLLYNTVITPKNTPTKKHLARGTWWNKFVGVVLTKSKNVTVLHQGKKIKLPNKPLYEGLVQGKIGIQRKVDDPLISLPENIKEHPLNTIKSSQNMLDQFNENLTIHDKDFSESVFFKEKNYILEQKEENIYKKDFSKQKYIIDEIDVTNIGGEHKVVIEETKQLHKLTETSISKNKLLTPDDVYNYINDLMLNNPIQKIVWEDNKIVIHYYLYEDCYNLIECDEILKELKNLD